MAYYSQAAQHVKHELAKELNKEEIRRLHKIQPVKHFGIVLWQLFLVVGSTIALILVKNPLIWIPLAFILGFTIFNFTVLLHEVVHNAVFVPSKKSRALNRILGLFYAFPSGISATQFTKWHLDHHAGLGSPTEDPKRHHLSPKVNKRWVKLLYYTPALPFIYFARVHKLLQPFYARRGMKAYGYGELFFRYVILNESPHSDWEPLTESSKQPPLAAAAL